MNTFTTIGEAAGRVVRGLTEKQKSARKGKLGGSDIACLMTGDVKKIYQLWLVKTGQAEEEDLSNVWPVQLGLYTEPFHLDWIERRLGEQIIDRGVFVNHPSLEWAGCTLDGQLRERLKPTEVKHCGGYEQLETIVDRYQPQVQWIMECGTWNECALSVIMGAKEPVIEWIPRDKEYADEMVKRGHQFMQHVWNKTLPVELPPVPPPVIPVKSYDMHGFNMWADCAATWLETKDYADRNKEAEKGLKGNVPSDAKEAYGHGVRITRDRAGRLSLRSII